MNDVIIEYQKWKEQGEDLRVKAKLAMETRYRELLLGAVKVAEEYRADFGGTLKAPPSVTSFRFKTGKAKKQKAAAVKPVALPAPPKKASEVKAEKKAPPAPAPLTAPSPSTDRKIKGLEKRLATAKKKLEAAKAAGAPTRDLDDRVYELEDELRVVTRAD